MLCGQRNNARRQTDLQTDTCITILQIRQTFSSPAGMRSSMTHELAILIEEIRASDGRDGRL